MLEQLYHTLHQLKANTFFCFSENLRKISQRILKSSNFGTFDVEADNVFSLGN